MRWVQLLLSAALLTSQPPTVAAIDRSGTYNLILGHIPRYSLELWENGAIATFTLRGPNVSATGSGTVSGDAMALIATVAPGTDLSMNFVFAPQGRLFSGTWRLSGKMRAEGSLAGTPDPWPTYDVDVLGVPPLVAADCVQLWKISRVSRFRSGEGHDFSDDFETCRSMKHYYFPLDGVDPGSIALFAPVSGTVIGFLDEWEDALWKGTAVGIRPDTQPSFNVALYHVRLLRPLALGERVAAGQLLGTSAKRDGTATDVVVGVHTPQGYRLLSFFQVMPEAVFAGYRARGVPSRANLVIPRAERDADPLACDGERFLGPGRLPNWVDLSPAPSPRPLRRRLPSAPHPGASANIGE